MAYFCGVHGGVGWSYFHGDVTQVGWDAYLAFLESLIERDVQRVAMMLISDRSDTPNAAMRRQLKEFMEGHEHRMGGLTANAMVLDSALARGALTAINWVFRKPFPERVFSSVDPALEWLAQMDAKVDAQSVRSGIEGAVPHFRG